MVVTYDGSRACIDTKRNGPEELFQTWGRGDIHAGSRTVGTGQPRQCCRDGMGTGCDSHSSSGTLGRQLHARLTSTAAARAPTGRVRAGQEPLVSGPGGQTTVTSSNGRGDGQRSSSDHQTEVAFRGPKPCEWEGSSRGVARGHATWAVPVG
jgi:hypothetical protein